MYEVELKVPADLDQVRGRLESLDADPRGTAEQVDSYFDHPERSFATTDEALRLRRTANEAWLTYKGPKIDADSKTRQEHETSIDAPDAAEALLRAVDFTLVAEVVKRREHFALDGYEITLDRVEDVGEFVEVEAVGKQGEIDELTAGAERLLDRLDLDPADQIRTSYLELLLDAHQ